MNFLKNTHYYLAFFLSFISASFSAELSSIHIVLLENPTLIRTAHFASRVHVFAPSSDSDEKKFYDHGVAVCSVLVGKNSSLQENTSITVVPSLDQFPCYVSTLKTEDLVILNWSGSTGYPGLSEDHLEELEGIREEFQTILEMDETQFSEQVAGYIRDYNGFLTQLPGNNPLSDLLSYAKECLLSTEKQSELRVQNRDAYLMGLHEKIETFRNYANSRARLKFEEMKATLQAILLKHDNTLIMWALGNEGECIDSNPFWQGLLPDQLILSHTILVYGLQNNGKKHFDSNYTIAYNNHALGKPYDVQVWDTETSRYEKDSGTSFSAPLATIDAFLRAKEILNQTSKTPSYSDVKHALLRK